MTSSFKGQFTQQSSIPDVGIDAAIEVLKNGRLHRYNTVGDELSETALLEQEYAKWQGSAYCLACASGGQAIQIALRAAGVSPGDKVLTNAFTLAPVPGAVAAVGGESVLVEITPDLVIDLEHFETQAQRSSARFLLLSHMRGHLVDMQRIAAIADRLGVTIIEDCAHTMGATWDGVRSGNFGKVACFSTQTYKHMNSGEGGFVTSDDPDLMARAIMMSGSYMLYARHGASPTEKHFESAKLNMPNMSARMDNLRAAILRPQLATIEEAIAAWNERYDRVASHLARNQTAILPKRPSQESYVGSSIQFLIPGISQTLAATLLERLAARGVEVKWFGGDKPNGFTSSHHSWRYVQPHTLPKTDEILAGLFDMRLPLSFSLEDCDLIAGIIVDELDSSEFTNALAADRAGHGLKTG